MPTKPFDGQNVRNLTPIISPTTHKILGYQDRLGRKYTPDGKASASLPEPGGFGGYLNQAPPEQQDAAAQAVDPRGDAERQQRQDQAAAAADAKAQLDAAEKLWIDGQYVTITRNADGTWTAKPVADQKAEGTPLMPPTAFDALDGEALDPTAPFLMGYQTDPNQKGSITSIFGQLGTYGKNMLTVGGGVSWLAELSTKDPEAYKAMVDRLHDAGYLDDGEYAATGTGWSAMAGSAFAKLARDVAVVNTTAAGQNTTLDQFLGQRVADFQAAKVKEEEEAYVPVQRAYTDPEDIKSAAVTEAEATLGRRLNPEEEAELVGHFRALEDAMYDTIDSAGAQKKNATFTKPGSGQVDAFVDSGAREQEAANFRAAGFGEALKQLFGMPRAV